MDAKVVEISVPIDEQIVLVAFQVEYQHMSGCWCIFNVYQDEHIANYIKEQLEHGNIQVPLVWFKQQKEEPQ